MIFIKEIAIFISNNLIIELFINIIINLIYIIFIIYSK